MNKFFNEQLAKRKEKDGEAKQKHPRVEKTYLSHFRPSEIGYEPRVIYLSVHGLIVWADSPATFRRFENGNSVHARWDNWFKHAGIIVASEQDITIDDPPMRGRLDNIITLDGLPYIVEIKSIEDGAYSELKEPQWNHLVQLSVYLAATGIPRGYLLYENKNNNTPKYFEISLDADTGTVHIACPRHGFVHYEGLIDKVYTKLRYVRKCIETGKVPVACAGCSKQCKWFGVCMEAVEGKEVLKL